MNKLFDEDLPCSPVGWLTGAALVMEDGVGRVEGEEFRHETQLDDGMDVVGRGSQEIKRANKKKKNNQWNMAEKKEKERKKPIPENIKHVGFTIEKCAHVVIKNGMETDGSKANVMLELLELAAVVLAKGEQGMATAHTGKQVARNVAKRRSQRSDIHCRRMGRSYEHVGRIHPQNQARKSQEQNG